jgi:thioredoxin
MIKLTKELFKEKIFNYTIDNDGWVFNGEKPAIIKFTADWCSPCRVLEPVLNEVESEHDDIDFYSVDVDKENELTQIIGIKSVPSILFVPMTGKPKLTMGALPKKNINDLIKEHLK